MYPLGRTKLVAIVAPATVGATTFMLTGMVTVFIIKHLLGVA